LDDLHKIFSGCHRNIAENLNRLSRAHERYRRQTDRRQTDGRQHIANVNVSSRSLKIIITQLLSAYDHDSRQCSAHVFRCRASSAEARRSAVRRTVSREAHVMDDLPRPRTAAGSHVIAGAGQLSGTAARWRLFCVSSMSLPQRRRTVSRKTRVQ